VGNGQGNRFSILFDAETGEILEVLKNAPLITADYRFSGINILDFEWSSSGEYLFYVSDFVMVYDIVNDAYLVEIDLNHNYSSADILRTIRWSADSHYVAFSLDTELLSHERFIGAVDVSEIRLYVSQSSYTIDPYVLIQGNLYAENFIWLSGQFRLAWVSPEQALIIYDVETDSSDVLDRNVVWILGS
jgi:hypothetical protein